MNIEKQIEKDIKHYKKQLIAKVKRKGIYENFGENEYRKLKDTYFDYYYTDTFKPIQDFSEWCGNYIGE